MNDRLSLTVLFCVVSLSLLANPRPAAAQDAPQSGVPRATFPTSTAQGSCTSLAFSEDSTLLALYTGDHALELIRTADGVSQQKIHTDARCASPSFSPDNRILLLSGDKETQALSTQSGKVVGVLPKGFLLSESFSANSERFATVRRYEQASKAADPQTMYALEVWDVSKLLTQGAWPKKPLWALTSEDEIFADHLAFSPDGSTLVMVENPFWGASCGGGDEWVTVRAFNAADGTENKAWLEALQKSRPEDGAVGETEQVPFPDYSEDDHRLISGFIEDIEYRAGVLYVFVDLDGLRWDLNTLAKSPETPPEHVRLPDTIQSFDDTSIRSDGDLLVVHYPSDLYILGSRGTPIKQLATPTGIKPEPEGALRLDLSPNAESVFVMGAQTAGLWSVEQAAFSGCVPSTLGRVSTHAFSPRGDLLIIWHEGRAYLWSTEALATRGAGSCTSP